jgi:SAM-dependent methyltransferase
MYGREYYEGEESNYGAFGGYGGRVFGLSRRLVRRKVFSMIGKHAKGGRLLDVGCAYGYLVDYAGRRGFEASGVDVSEYAVGEARKRFPGLDVRVADIEKGAGFGEGSLDVVTAMDVLEHCSDLEGTLAGIRGMLKRGGLLMASFPDSELFPEEKDRDRTHVWRMTMGGWLEAFRRSGFEVLETGVFPSWMRRIRPEWCVSMALLRKA